jgi:putative membrane protein
MSVVVVLVALTSPLHELSDRYLFSAHMVQHLLLMLVMPPLLIAGLTDGMLRPYLVRPGVLPVARFLTRPLVAYALCNFAFAASHLPNLYEITLRNHGWHVLEHIVFMVTAVLLWWPLLSPVPEMPRPNFALQLLYIFLQVLPGSLIGGLISNSTRPIYRFYAEAPRISSLTVVQDQQLGAIIMWVGGGLYFLGVFTVVWFTWAARDDAAARGRPSVATSPPGQGLV